MESKVKGAICSLQEDVKNHINILSLTSWNTQLIINLVIMASCIGCFLRKSVVWKMCLLTSSYWDMYFLCESQNPVICLCLCEQISVISLGSMNGFKVHLLPLPFNLRFLSILLSLVPGKHIKVLKSCYSEVQWKEGECKAWKNGGVLKQIFPSGAGGQLWWLLKYLGSFLFTWISIELAL